MMYKVFEDEQDWHINLLLIDVGLEYNKGIEDALMGIFMFQCITGGKMPYSEGLMRSDPLFKDLVTQNAEDKTQFWVNV